MFLYPVASILKSTQMIYLTFEKNNPFIYLISQKVDIFIYFELIYPFIYSVTSLQMTLVMRKPAFCKCGPISISLFDFLLNRASSRCDIKLNARLLHEILSSVTLTSRSLIWVDFKVIGMGEDGTDLTS